MRRNSGQEHLVGRTVTNEVLGEQKYSMHSLQVICSQLLKCQKKMLGIFQQELFTSLSAIFYEDQHYIMLLLILLGKDTFCIARLNGEYRFIPWNRKNWNWQRNVLSSRERPDLKLSMPESNDVFLRRVTQGCQWGNNDHPGVHTFGHIWPDHPPPWYLHSESITQPNFLAAKNSFNFPSSTIFPAPFMEFVPESDICLFGENYLFKLYQVKVR